MPPEIGSIVPNSHSGNAINNIKSAAITQLISALGPAICAPIKGVNSHAEPIMPPAAAINILLVEISRFSNFRILNKIKI